MKRDLTMIRGELMTVGKSSKSIKRDSINPAKAFRRESSSKITKGSGLGHSNSSVLLLQPDVENKENKENKSQHIDAKDCNKMETNASAAISVGDNEL